MKPKWLIEDFALENNFSALADEVKKQGMECEVIKYIPFESGTYNVFKDSDCVIVQSSLQLAGQLLKEKKWIPNAWLSLDNYECSRYYSYFGKYLLNYNYIMLPRSEVKRRFKSLLDLFSREELFIRPSSGFKTFSGQIFDREHFDKDWSFVEEFTFPESLIVVSSPKNIVYEWRFVIVNNEIITGSLYKSFGNKYLKLVEEDLPLSIHDLGAIYITQNILENVEFRPDPVFVIDICKAGDGNFYLLEIGSFSCAGLYACNLEKIVSAVSKAAIEEYCQFHTESNER